MTTEAAPGRARVDQNILCANCFSLEVAQAARNALVRAREREDRAFLVVKQRRPPLLRRVAARAVVGRGEAAELAAVDVGVTAGARRGRGTEHRVTHTSVPVSRPVAVDASHRAMRAGERESGQVVIEA